ncbi:SMEK domain-containing protein [Thiothrix subterranea]|uniref:SMEK domain-containing protein n=1 Tax=Thiothrix subterranea TaxID=2735563 RepID=UPI00280B65FA|nr:SMEK domain-containing protein [Thiothrix subterranea]
MNSEDYFNKINRELSVLQFEIKNRGSLNLRDINIHSEFLFCKLLNMIFGYNLEAKSSSDTKAVAIDLYDDKLKVAVQVTSTPEFDKISKTTDKFISNQLHKEYKKLIILVLSKKKKYRKGFYPDAGDFQLDLTEDIWDIERILQKIRDLNDAKKLRDIHDFLNSEFGKNGDVYKSRDEITEKFKRISKIGRNWFRTIGDDKIERTEVKEAIEFINQEARSILITAPPGSGKTCVLLDIAEYVESEDKYSLLFIKDEKSIREYKIISSEASIVSMCKKLSASKRLVIIIDSLDVLSLTNDGKIFLI